MRYTGKGTLAENVLLLALIAMSCPVGPRIQTHVGDLGALLTL